ncbi:MAG TPA: hypothetical protein PLE33_02165 [Candidatus Cloacimonas sp.]|nr:hypothetical protein [Candidatus Cloacimonas sp.]HPS60051.1 hypothetical protein [Candidatus Cloacimonas sp.]
MLKKLIIILILVTAIALFALAHRPPKEFVLQTDVLNEASGIDFGIQNKQVLWSHNDSGNKAEIYALNTEGQLLSTLSLKGVQNRDWEDIAVAKDPLSDISYIYIADIGDNNAKYNSVYVYRLREPQLTGKDEILQSSEFKTIEINYEDGPRDAEAIFLEPETGDIYIISKREEQVGLYRIAYPFNFKDKNIARRITSLPLTWVTAADLSSNGKQLLVKTYTGIFKYKTKLDAQKNITLSKEAKTMPYLTEPQGEALCWDAKNKSYYTLSESARGITQTLYYYK